MKVHIHSEQFDGHGHAACGRLDMELPSDRIASEDDFEKVPYEKRCRLCAREW